MHLICPPKFWITFVLYFSRVLQPSQEKLKTMLKQNFGGQIRGIMGDVQGANCLTLAVLTSPGELECFYREKLGRLEE